MIDLGRKDVLGIPIDALDYEAAVRRVINAAHRGNRLTVAALAVHGVMTGVDDAAYRSRLRALDLVVPDGQPVRWAVNALHRLNLRDRVYGPALMSKVCAAAARKHIPVFFYGSHAEIVTRLASRARQTYPGLTVAGYQPSLFRRATVDERTATIERIKASGARILFVGLGCPRQEVFAYEMGRFLPMPILAVGAAFDYHSGALSEPPGYVQRAGLQWLYRLAQEPRRLWRRYLFLNTRFTFKVLQQLYCGTRPDTPDPVGSIEELNYA